MCVHIKAWEGWTALRDSPPAPFCPGKETEYIKHTLA